MKLKDRTQTTTPTRINQRIVTLLTLRNACWIALVCGCLISLTMLWGHIDPITLSVDPDFHVVLAIPFNVLMSLVVYLFCFYMLRTEGHLALRIIITIVGAILIGLFFSMLMSVVSHWVYADASVPRTFSLYAIKDGSVAVFFVMLALLIFSVSRQHRIAMELEQLRTAHAVVNYDVLRKELSPHFLFNSLNVLEGLIQTDPDKATTCLHHLSALYRNTDEYYGPLTLHNEMEQARSYLYIMQERCGEALRIETLIADRYLSQYVVSFSVLQLLENVVRHNVISLLHPLTITIETTEHGTLRVTNTLQPRVEDGNSRPRVGLSNLQQRYKLLFDHDIEVLRTTDTFSVEIPLIAEHDALSSLDHLRRQSQSTHRLLRRNTLRNSNHPED